jgi:hypothetical protein
MKLLLEGHLPHHLPLLKWETREEKKTGGIRASGRVMMTNSRSSGFIMMKFVTGRVDDGICYREGEREREGERVWNLMKRGTEPQFLHSARTMKIGLPAGSARSPACTLKDGRKESEKGIKGKRKASY